MIVTILCVLFLGRKIFVKSIDCHLGAGQRRTKNLFASVPVDSRAPPVYCMYYYYYRYYLKRGWLWPTCGSFHMLKDT